MATSGSRLPPAVEKAVGTDSLGTDMRTVEGRRWRDHIRHLAEQLDNAPTHSQGLILRRTATLALFLERADARLLAGEAVDQATYRANTDKLKSCLVQLGLLVKSRDVLKSDQQPDDAHALALFGAG